MMQYCYRYKYSFPASAEQLRFHCDLFVVADKYAVDDLSHFCTKKFQSAVNEKHWTDAAMPDIIRYVYDSTPPNDGRLRDIVAERMARHMQHSKGTNIFATVMEELGEFSRDVAIQLVRFLRAKEEELRKSERNVADLESQLNGADDEFDF